MNLLAMYFLSDISEGYRTVKDPSDPRYCRAGEAPLIALQSSFNLSTDLISKRTPLTTTSLSTYTSR